MRILSILLLVLLSACASKKVDEPTKSQGPTYELSEISLKRTACYGTCPVYEMIISSSGTVLYTGEKHVDLIGKFEGELSDESVSQLFEFANQLPWDNYPESYPIDNFDFPQFYISVKSSDFNKSVKGNTRAAEELITLGAMMDDLLGQVELKEQP